jgi:hypothetical protein
MRTKLLTYWTGKDITIEVAELTSTARLRYTQRLEDILNHGFWMTIPDERMLGRGDGSRPTYIDYQVPMTCFTELRASLAKPHRRLYGLLGIVVNRAFVMERSGGPVHYVRNHAADGVVGNISRVLDWMKAQVEAARPGAQEMLDTLPYPLAFMKGMSNEGADDYAYIDEFEWRVIHTHQQMKAGRIIATGLQIPKYRLPVTSDDLKMVIVPDDEIRTEALRKIQAWTGGHTPPVLTIQEVEQL